MARATGSAVRSVGGGGGADIGRRLCVWWRSGERERRRRGLGGDEGNGKCNPARWGRGTLIWDGCGARGVRSGEEEQQECRLGSRGGTSGGQERCE